jgi:hypothetical protein
MSWRRPIDRAACAIEHLCSSGATPDGSFHGGADGPVSSGQTTAGVQVVPQSVRLHQSARSPSSGGRGDPVESAAMTSGARHHHQQRTADAATRLPGDCPEHAGAARGGAAERARQLPPIPTSSKWRRRRACLRLPSTQNAIARVDLWRALLAQAVAQGTRRSSGRCAPRECRSHVVDCSALRRPITFWWR